MTGLPPDGRPKQGSSLGDMSSDLALLFIDLPRLASPTEVGRALGIDPRTIRRYCLEGRLVAVKLGDARNGPIRISRDSVVRFVEASRVRPEAGEGR